MIKIENSRRMIGLEKKEAKVFEKPKVESLGQRGKLEGRRKTSNYPEGSIKFL